MRSWVESAASNNPAIKSAGLFGLLTQLLWKHARTPFLSGQDLFTCRLMRAVLADCYNPFNPGRTIEDKPFSFQDIETFLTRMLKEPTK